MASLHDISIVCHCVLTSEAIAVDLHERGLLTPQYYQCFFLSHQAIEFFFFAGLIFVVTIIFGIMSFFYKYVDLTGHDEEPSNRDSTSHDESSALIVDNGTVLDDQKQPYTSPPMYATESEGELVWDKSGMSGEATRSESEF